MQEETYTCEGCGRKFGKSKDIQSVRFCCEHCRRVYIGRHSVRTRMAAGTFVPPRNTKAGGHTCKLCGEVFETKVKLRQHRADVHKTKRQSWCKGLTKETNESLRHSSETLKHRYHSGDLIHSFTGRHLSEEHKRKISESMKAAQKDGKAHNIGQCRWERKHSYPEEWLIGVIANEFSDKQYICEMSFHRFALDFAWIHKKKCIEMDGGWHDRPDQQERDRCKDELLKQEGWQVLRMPWKEVLKDKQGWIAKAKEFIDS